MESSPCKCRICKRPLEYRYQKHWKTGNDEPLVTCWNPDCDMNGYTLSLCDYPTMNLEPYLKTQKES